MIEHNPPVAHTIEKEIDMKISWKAGRTKAFVLAAALASVAIGAGVSNAATTPGFTLGGSVTYGGTGCPQGSLAYEISSDGTAMTVFYDKFVAALGPGANGSAYARRNCQLTIPIKVPNGFTYGVTSIDYRGYSDIVDSGVTATQTAQYRFQGYGSQRLTSQIQPDDGGYWQISDVIPMASVNFKPCNVDRTLIVNDDIWLRNNGGALTTLNTVGMDSADISTDTVFNIPLNGGHEFKIGIATKAC